jgi:hypothetical protein
VPSLLALRSGPDGEPAGAKPAGATAGGEPATGRSHLAACLHTDPVTARTRVAVTPP